MPVHPFNTHPYKMCVSVCSRHHPLWVSHAQFAMLPTPGAPKHPCSSIFVPRQVVKFLAENRALLGTLASLPMASFVKATQPVIKTTIGASVGEALRTLVGAKITGLPVVDDDDHIIANLSVSDVRYLAKLKQEDVDRVLSTNIVVFLTEAKGVAPGTAVSLSPAIVHASDTFGSAVELLAASGLHRLYVVDDVNTPVGVVSLTDIIHTIVSAL